MKLVLGDIHAKFSDLNTFLNKVSGKYNNVTIFQVGDFGVWQDFDKISYENGILIKGDANINLSKYLLEEILLSKIKVPNNTKLYFCNGNHENYDILNEWEEAYGKVPIEVFPNIFYCPKGTFLELDGKTTLFMGGADSIDKQWRTPGYDWFPDETIKERDIIDLPDRKVDTLICHTCPESILKYVLPYPDNALRDPSRLALEYVFDKYRPRHMYFGHFHTYKKGAISITSHWTCLNQIGQTGWWEIVDE